MVADATTTVESGFASTAGEMTSFDVTSKGDQIVYATCAYEKNGLSEREWKRSPRHVSRYGYELAVVDVDGTEPRRLTANRLFDNYPSWSPGGERVAFLTGGLSGREGWGRYLATMAADGSQRREFEIDGKVVLHPPQWSPDETRLAVVGEVPNGRTLAIYTMRADGSDVRRLGAAASGPAWSPDGSRIAFATEEGDEIALYTMAADGTDARKVPIDPRWAPRYEGEHGVLVENEEYEKGIKKWITTLEWSPGGDRLLYTCGWQVCVVDLDGTPVGESPVDLGSGSVAAWSPDGTRIAVGLGVTWPTEDTEREYRDGDVALYSMAPDGGDLRILAVYSPSGRSVAGATSYTIRYRKLAGIHSTLSWRPNPPLDIDNDSEWTPIVLAADSRQSEFLTHQITQLSLGFIYGIHIEYENGGERYFAAREGYVWPSLRPAGNGDRVATFPMNNPLGDDLTYAYYICDDYFPKNELRDWVNFIWHALEQWETATDGLVTMTYKGDKCADYSQVIEKAGPEIRARAQELILLAVDNNFEEDVRNLIRAIADWMDIHDLDVAQNEIKLIDDSEGSLHHVLARVQASSGIAKDLGFALCPQASACTTRPEDPDAGPSADILLLTTYFRTIPSAFTLATPTKLSYGQCDVNDVTSTRYATVIHEGGHALGINTGRTSIRLPDGGSDPHHASSTIVDSLMIRYPHRADCYPTPLDVMAIYALYQIR